MYVSNIKINNNKNYACPLFKSKQPVVKNITKSTTGKLAYTTSRNLGDVLRAYKDIRAKLACITKEGLEHIQKEFPNITIGESLIFHNCGDFKTSILVRCAESVDNAGLSRIIERKGNSSWSDKIVINSFLIDGDDKLLKNPDVNKQKLFPKNREYLTAEEISEQGLEKSLLGVLESLDPVLLSFRQYLKTVDSKYQRVPDGKLPYTLVDKLCQIKRDHVEIEAALKKLPTAVNLAIRKSYPNYKLVTGLTTHAFENLGDEKVSLTYNPILSPNMQNLRRLNVFDEAGKLIRTFVVTTEGKMVSNINQNYTTHLPDKLSFVNADDIQDEKFLPSFEKYLTMYSQNLVALKEHINKFLAERLRLMESMPQEFPSLTQNNFIEILRASESIDKILSSMPVQKGIEIKNSVPDLYAPAGKKGLFFDGFRQDKRVHFLLMKSKRHEGLTRLTITNADGNEKMYLIKDGKYLVKNFNTQYPQMTPKRLIFKKMVDGDFDPELLEALNYIKDKITVYEEVARDGLNKHLLLKQEEQELKEARKLEKKQALLEQRQLLHKEKENLRLERARLREERKEAQRLEKEAILQQKGLARQRLMSESRLERLRKQKEQKERKEFLASCKDKISIMRQNLDALPEEFEKMLKDFKDFIEGFGKDKE